MNNRTGKVYYTFWLAATEEVVAFGYSDQCERMLGIAHPTFLSTVSRIKKGKNRKYYIAEELVEEEEDDTD